MVTGLDRFRDYFADYRDRYVLIGGTAMWLVLDEAGLRPRATRDLDIVLCIEALDSEFATYLWEFIRAGGYQIQQKSVGEKTFYRFGQPSEEDYPLMLELFSRQPEKMALGDDSHLTPIPVAEDVSSLSAILLDDVWYEFIHRNAREIDGVSIVDQRCLIPLKARAWLDLVDRKANGEKIDSKDIKKHRNDVIRLFQLLAPEERIALPEAMATDLELFLQRVEQEIDGNLLANLDIKGTQPDEVIAMIGKVFEIPVNGDEG